MNLFPQNLRGAERETTPPGDGSSARQVSDSDGLGLPGIGADVIDSQGVYASVVAVHAPGLACTPSTHTTMSDVLVLMAAGQEVRLPRNLLRRESEQVYRVPFAFATLVELPANMPADGAVHTAPADTLVVPVLEESLQVTTRLAETGRGLRLHKTILETPHTVEQALLRETFTVEHVAYDQLVEQGSLPQAHYEGDTLVIPVFEEVLVVQKQMRLKEEIRVTRVQQTVATTQTVILRSEQVRIERFDDSKAGKS